MEIKLYLKENDFQDNCHVHAHIYIQNGTSMEYLNIYNAKY